VDKQEYIEIYGARENNLKNISVNIPRNKLVVITGVSGSGKSSLAFDTIYAEGQRRYMESFSAYARSFIGDMERPEVDKIEGLSPVISIEQKTTGRNPRSTVGTSTEIYDFMRLLFARAGIAHSYINGKPMIKQSEEQIVTTILEQFDGKKVVLLAPVIRARKGHYKELFVQFRKSGFTKARIDGKIEDLDPALKLDRYKIHDIELVIDKLLPTQKDKLRISQSVQIALKQGKNVIAVLDDQETVHYFSKNLMDPENGISYDEPSPNNFSFNSPYGSCPKCSGLGHIEEFNLEAVIPDPDLTIAKGVIAPLGDFKKTWIFNEIEKVCQSFGFGTGTAFTNLSDGCKEVLLNGGEYAAMVKSMSGKMVPYHYNFEGVIPYLTRHYQEGTEAQKSQMSDYLSHKTCDECNGERLKIESRHFLIYDKNISQLAQLNLEELALWFVANQDKLNTRQQLIANEILKEINKRLNFLLDVGLGYLSLDRPLRTLSGGESQRIRLATQIGTQLVGVTYILDEPSIGLHQRDNEKLIKALKDLRDLGNTVLVVEHDKDMMLEADYLLDIGPGAGRLGGTIVTQGHPKSLQNIDTPTANYINNLLKVDIPLKRREGNGKALKLVGATGHNLKNVDLTLPLGKFICVTGVSGSGKSSLIHETLHPILAKYFYRSIKTPLPYKDIEGLKNIDKVIEVDQSPIGRTPRSNPATYTGVFSDIRDLFTQLPESKIRGYKVGRFSFNVVGGRCEDCQGGGVKVIEMDFLPSVHVDCETCKRKRYNRETLEVRFKGKSIADVLDMTVNQAVEFFESQPKIVRKIQTLKDVGLGYITLGQHATTLSGGEAQRVKLATELSKRDTGKTMFILDEPSTGLHFQDILHLLAVLNQLVDKGNTVLVIEHNLDIIVAADHVIDVGPEGGKAGGTIVATGTPEEVAKNKKGFTSKFIKLELESYTS
jgi:excinuclease ABC subunit A